MEYFEKLKIQLHRLGIFYSNSKGKGKMIAVAIRCGLFVFSTVYLLTLACYHIFEAHTPEKHAETLFCFFGALLAVLWYTALLFKSQKYAKFLDEVNEIIESSKFN